MTLRLRGLKLASSFQPISVEEAQKVVDAILLYDPMGNDACPYCAHPDRKQIDVDLLSNANLAAVVEQHSLGIRDTTEAFSGREFAQVCSAVERHRRHHLIKVFEKLSDDSDFPEFTSPTVRFIDWTVKEHYQMLREGLDPKDRITALKGMVSALRVRADVRGETAGKNKNPDTIETEALLTPDQQRKALELAARKLGLKLVDAKPKEIEATATRIS